MRSMGHKPLTRFEIIAQRLVEGSLSRLMGDRVEVLEVAATLARALEDSQQEGMAANYFQIVLHPVDYQYFEQERSAWNERLGTYVRELVRQGGLTLAAEPILEFVVDETLRRHQIQVTAERTERPGEITEVFEPNELVSLEQIRALDAFLIVNGKRHVALEKPLIKIGRRVDNDVIIDSPVVSRQHAHIRWRYGRYVLYDVGSRGGITVNGDSCRECVLQPGDLISLSHRIPIIYGEGLENRSKLQMGDDHGHDTMALPGTGEA